MTNTASTSRGSLRHKLFLGAAALVLIPLGSVLTILHFQLASQAETTFSEHAQAEMRQADQTIATMVDNAFYNLDSLARHPATQGIDASSVNSFAERTTPTDLTQITRSPTEAALYQHIKLLADTHPNYTELFLGTRHGGFVTSQQNTAFRAGYDPRQRPWWGQAEAAKGKPMLTRAYFSTVGGFVTSAVQSHIGSDGQADYTAGIGISLKGLSDMVNSIKIGQSGYLIITEADGVVLAHPRNPDVLGKNIDTLQIPELSNAIKQPNTLMRFKADGRTQLVIAHAASRADWRIIAVIDEQEITASQRSLLQKMLGLGLLFAGLAVAAAFVFARQLSQGILRINQIMAEIAQGGGDLTRRIEINGRDEIAQTAHHFNQFLDTLQRMFAQLRQQAGQLTDGVGRIHHTVEQLGQDFRELSDQSTSNAATIEEITVSIAHIADHADEADKLVRQTSDTSRASAGTISAVATAVSASSSDVESMHQLLGQLRTRAQDISGISLVIKDIADQTNLLALNAAIEAARAGEQGRGFAVVADEVRKLAERTGQATQQINQMTEAIRQDTGEAVDSMQHALGTSRSSVDSAEEASAQINHILQHMDHVRSKMSEIAHSTHEEQTATTLMAQNAELITNRMLDAQQQLHQATVTLQQLDDLAQQLQSQFANFRT